MGLWRMLTEPKMALSVRNCFTDVVTGQPVNLYVDHRGFYWLATNNSHWAFRTLCDIPKVWLEMDRRRLQAAATLPVGQPVREM